MDPPKTLENEPQKIGLAIRGGGFLGIFEVGALKVIEEYGIPIEMGIGDSVGAINLSAFFSDGCSVEHLISVWMSLKNPSSVFDREYTSHFLWQLGRVSSLYRIKPLLRLIGDNLDANKLVGQPKEFFTAVTHLVTGKVLHISNKDPEIVADPIKNLLIIAASCAIPGLFPPVPIKYQGSYEWYVDGVCGRTAPIRKCIEVGCDTVIVIRCHSEKVPNKVPEWWGPGLSVALTMHSQSKEEDEIIAVRKEYPQVSIFVVEPEWIPDSLTTVSFKKGDFEKTLAEGERIARRELEPLRHYFRTRNNP